MREGNELIGWGMATSVYPTRRSASNASARLNADGTFSVDAGTQDLGTGTYTIMTQIAADSFGVPPNQVKFRLGDTITAANAGFGRIADRREHGLGGVSGGASAAREADPDGGQRYAIAALGRQRAGRCHSRMAAYIRAGNPSKGETFQALIARSGQPHVEAQANAKPGAEKERYSMYAFGAQFAEVRVDADLGQIRVSRMVGCFGAGKILNAKTARSQFIGGMVWGISMALYEHAAMDKRLGRWVNNNLAEYHVPVNLDVGKIEAHVGG